MTLTDEQRRALEADVIRSLYHGPVRSRERNHAEVKWRASGDPDTPTVRNLTGYPAVFGQVYTLYEGDSYILTEEVLPGFFDDVLEDDCHLNYNHERPSAMCRNAPHMPAGEQEGPGSMSLSVDAHGLRVHARVPMDDLDAQRLAPKMDRGVVTQMSYAFTVAEEDRLETKDPDGRYRVHYTLKKARRLLDLAVCPLGANASTEVALRSLAGQLMGRSLAEGPPSEPSRADEAGPEAGVESRSIEGSPAPDTLRATAELEATRAFLAARPARNHA